MKQAKNLFELVRGAIWPALALMVIAFFGGYALFGSNGVLAWGEYSQRYQEKQNELIAIEKQRGELANRVALLDPRHANPDMVDELVRRDLGLAHPDEVIIPLN
jgi:cell division protein FtsB